MKKDNDDFHKEISFLKHEINRSLKKILIKDEPKYLYDPIKYSINNSGKRLRPILVFLTGKLFESNVNDLMKAAVAVELRLVAQSNIVLIVLSSSLKDCCQKGADAAAISKQLGKQLSA